jgi:hypothetical protein
MGMLIDGHKVFENEHLVVYTFEWADGPAAGTIAAAKSDIQRHVTMPGDELDRIAAKVLVKAMKQSEIDGAWPETVVYAS